MFCGGCGVDRCGVDLAVFAWVSYSGDGGYYLADFLVGVWCGWMSDYLSSYYVA